MTEWPLLAFVGSLDRTTSYFGPPHGQGITVFGFDPVTGAFATMSQTQGADNPTFLAIAADGRSLYATSEVLGWHEGVVTAYQIEPGTGQLTYINKQPTRGSIAAHVSLDPNGRWLLVSNYRMGEVGLRPSQAVAVFPIESDGGLGPPACSVTHAGAGPDPERQEGPHPHCAVTSPDGKHVLVADLGIDQIVIYRFDDISGQLTRTATTALPPGTGPRHIAFAPSGEYIAVTGELANTVTSFTWRSGSLTEVSTVSTLPAGAHGVSHSADIQISPDGRFVYASNRGHDSIAVFAMDVDGRIRLKGHRPTRRTPRSFALDPSGGFVLVAAQDEDTVTVFRRDPDTGLLSEPGAETAVGSPLCVRVAASLTSEPFRRQHSASAR